MKRPAIRLGSQKTPAKSLVVMAAKTPSTRLRTGFTVRHGGIRLKVSLLATVRDVHLAYQASPCGTRRRDGKLVHAFFQSTQPGAKHVGTAFFPLEGGNLNELVPHEVTHAVLHKVRVAAAVDDEGFATAIGMLSARILRRIKQLGAV